MRMRGRASIACAVLLLGCGQQGGAPASKGAAPTPSGVLVTVNGVALTEDDVKVASRSEGHGEAPAQPAPIDGIVIQELVYQRALALGLDQDPAYQKRRQEIDAQANAQKRRELGQLYFTKEIVGKITVSDDEARRFFDEHKDEIASEIHVLQLMRRGEDQAKATLAELDKGKPFEEVAAMALGGTVPPDQKPWDLGFLKWTQLPGAWRGVVDKLAPGKTSPLIAGPRGRYWIVKVVARRPDPAATFEAMRAGLVELLKRDRVEEAQKKTEKTLRDGASIVHPSPRG